MKTINKPKKELVQTPIFEPFPEPRTMPEGWDLSALLPDSNPPDVDPFKDLSAN
jgi:hypothetical protein